MGNRIHIIGGGTFSHVRNHLALASPAFGETARKLYAAIHQKVFEEVARLYPNISLAAQRIDTGRLVTLHLTKMAAPRQSNLVTNEDVSNLLDELIADPDTRVIILNAALCDFDAEIDGVPSGSHAARLHSRDASIMGNGDSLTKWRYDVRLTPSAKLIGKIRKDRKDIFVVGFKTTTGASSDEQYRIALDMLKRDSLNLVLANDTVTRNNMIVAPEETRYFEGTDRNATLDGLVKMVLARSTNTFTRSTVKHGDTVAWDSPDVPENLRAVVDHLIERGAYKPFRGATAGHFAVRIDDKTILTSKRKVNFNDLAKIGLVRVEYEGDDKVIAFGAKPSVGGQSQRQVFRDHPGYDCIVHAHVPLRESGPDLINVAPQWQNECGSHQCGANTSRNLREIESGIKVVMLDGHGPNVVFRRDTPAERVIAFIERNFDIEAKTGGLVEPAKQQLRAV